MQNILGAETPRVDRPSTHPAWRRLSLDFDPIEHVSSSLMFRTNKLERLYLVFQPGPTLLKIFTVVIYVCW